MEHLSVIMGSIDIVAAIMLLMAYGVNPLILILSIALFIKGGMSFL